MLGPNKIKKIQKSIFHGGTIKCGGEWGIRMGGGWVYVPSWAPKGPGGPKIQFFFGFGGSGGSLGLSWASPMAPRGEGPILCLPMDPFKGPVLCLDDALTTT